MTIKHGVACRSGLRGWQATLQENYENSFKVFQAYAEIYSIHERLGYRTPEQAWEANPTMQGSVEPSDLCKVVNGQRIFIPDKDELSLLVKTARDRHLSVATLAEFFEIDEDRLNGGGMRELFYLLAEEGKDVDWMLEQLDTIR